MRRGATLTDSDSALTDPIPQSPAPVRASGQGQSSPLSGQRKCLEWRHFRFARNRAYCYLLSRCSFRMHVNQRQCRSWQSSHVGCARAAGHAGKMKLPHNTKGIYSPANTAHHKAGKHIKETVWHAAQTFVTLVTTAIWFLATPEVSAGPGSVLPWPRENRT